jgi:hypothetical protein
MAAREGRPNECDVLGELIEAHLDGREDAEAAADLLIEAAKQPSHSCPAPLCAPLRYGAR